LIVDRRSTSLKSLDALSKALNGAIQKQVGILQTLPTEEHPIAEQIYWAEAVQLDLQQIGGRVYLLLRPDVFIWPVWARQEARTFLDQRRGGWFDKQANTLLDAWIRVLLPAAARAEDHDLLAFDGPEGPGNPIFTVNTRTTFSRRPAA